MKNKIVPFSQPMSEEPSPWDKPAVAKAMEALSPHAGASIGDVQAVAQLCLSALIDFSEREAVESAGSDKEYERLMVELTSRLRVAWDLLETAPYMEIEEEC